MVVFNEGGIPVLGSLEYKSSPDGQPNMSRSVEFESERPIPNHKFVE